MEIKIEEIKVKIKRRGPNSEPKMRYFKIPLCRIFHWKSEIDPCQWHVRSKIGVWHYKIQSYFSAEYHWYDNFYIPDTSKIYSDILLILTKLLFIMFISIETGKQKNIGNNK